MSLNKTKRKWLWLVVSSHWRRGTSGSEDDNVVFSGNPIRPCERGMAPPVQFMFSRFYVYLAETEGAVNYVYLRLDCEKAFSGVRRWTSMRPSSKPAFPNTPFVTNAFKDLASSRRCPSQMQAWRIIKEIKDKKQHRCKISWNANVKQCIRFSE